VSSAKAPWKPAKGVRTALNINMSLIMSLTDFLISGN
jgi:hypothetical protein